MRPAMRSRRANIARTRSYEAASTESTESQEPRRLGLRPNLLRSDDEAEDDRGDHHALGAVHRDADPRAPVALRRVREDERVQQRGRDRPRHVQVVAGEEDPVRDPVTAAEGAVHAWEQEAAEQ